MSGPNGPDGPGGSSRPGRPGDAAGSDRPAAAGPMGEPSVAVVLGTASGGTARHAGMLAEGCRRAGLAMLAIGPASAQPAFRAGADAWSDGGQSPAIPFHLAEIAERPRPAHDLAVLLRLRRLLRQARPDVVHAHGMRAGAFAALALRPARRGRPGRSGRRDRPALVVTVHNAPPPGRAGRAVFGLLELICARRADAVLCASADLADRMRRRGAVGVAEFDVPALPAPRPSAEAVARARHDAGADGRPVVLAAGRLAPQKGFDILLAAAAHWRDRDPVPRLAIAGSGPLAANLAAAAEQSGTDLVLLGERDDVPALLAAAEVVAVPSRWEARALIVQEALRAGAPVVASRTGGTPGLTGPDAAILVPPEDAGALAAAILAVLDDRELSARLSEAGRARAAALPTAADAVTAAMAVYRNVRPSR
jgi:glycosyltransferase involved in cell wall biosynthesis